MSDDLKTVARFVTVFEADVARNYLTAAGVRTFLADDNSVGWLWHLGVALNGVKVLVAASDVERARELLAEVAAKGPGQPDEPPAAHDETEPDRGWTCPKCHEQVDEGFDVCWSCGTTADGTDRVELPDEAAPGDRPLDLPQAPRPAPKQAEPPEATTRRQPPPRWVCPKCGSRVDADLAVCWACGTTADGQEDLDFQTADATDRASQATKAEQWRPPGPGAAVLIAFGIPMCILLAAGFFRSSEFGPLIGVYALIVLSCYALLIAFCRRWLFPEIPDPPAADTAVASPEAEADAAAEEDEEEEPGAVHTQAMIRRACLAAVLGMALCGLPVLNLYSLWLILRHRLYRREVCCQLSIYVYMAMAIDVATCLLLAFAVLLITRDRW